MLYKILPVLTIFACTILSQLVVEGCKRMYVFVCLYLFWVCIYFPTISFAFLGLPRLVMHPKQEIATLVLAAAWCCGFACICVFFMYFLLFFVCLLRTFFCQQRISQLATNARARGDRCAPQDPNMYLYTCICTCFMYLRVFVFKTLVSRWPAGKRASNYKWATGATKLLLLAAPFVRNFTPKKVRS